MKFDVMVWYVWMFIIIEMVIASPIVIKLKETNQKTFTANICMGGSELNCNDLHVTLNENEISVYKNCKYRPTLSPTSKFIADLTSPSTLYSDTVIIMDSSTQESISFETYIEEIHITNRKKNGFLGLGRTTDNNHLTPISQLYKIANDKKAFYIDIKQKEIVIGTYPPILTSRKIKYINYINDDKKYSCIIDSAFFKTYNNEYVQYEIPFNFDFCLSNSGISVPKDFVEFVFKHYLGHLIRDTTCKIIDNNGFLFVKCRSNYDYENDITLNDITFILDNTISIRLSRMNLFTKFDDEIFFLIIYNPDIQGYSFGYPFFNKYIMLIDDENKRIGVYSHHN